MSREPTVVIRFDGDSRVYQPGEVFGGEYWIEAFRSDQIEAIEASVLWHTEGKGDEDMAVHEFWQRSADEFSPIEAARPERFNTTMPNSPLSYEGRIIKLRWCVRVRVFPRRGKEFVGEKCFQLGDVPAVRVKSCP